MNIAIKLLRESAKMPAYQTDGAAGLDLHWCPCQCDGTIITVNKGARYLFGTGIAVSIPPGFEGQPPGVRVVDVAHDQLLQIVIIPAGVDGVLQRGQLAAAGGQKDVQDGALGLGPGGAPLQGVDQAGAAGHGQRLDARAAEQLDQIGVALRPAQVVVHGRQQRHQVQPRQDLIEDLVRRVAQERQRLALLPAIGVALQEAVHGARQLLRGGDKGGVGGRQGHGYLRHHHTTVASSSSTARAVTKAAEEQSRCTNGNGFLFDDTGDDLPAIPTKGAHACVMCIPRGIVRTAVLEDDPPHTRKALAGAQVRMSTQAISAISTLTFLRNMVVVSRSL